MELTNSVRRREASGAHKIHADHTGNQCSSSARASRASRRAPGEIVLDFDATDSLIHGGQEGRFFHGYYGGYCYLPLYCSSE
ncbi:MAG: transposase [Verrucomicrobiales bacterium]